MTKWAQTQSLGRRRLAYGQGWLLMAPAAGNGAAGCADHLLRGAGCTATLWYCGNCPGCRSTLRFLSKCAPLPAVLNHTPAAQASWAQGMAAAAVWCRCSACWCQRCQASRDASSCRGYQAAGPAGLQKCAVAGRHMAGVYSEAGGAWWRCSVCRDDTTSTSSKTALHCCQQQGMRHPHCMHDTVLFSQPRLAGAAQDTGPGSDPGSAVC